MDNNVAHNDKFASLLGAELLESQDNRAKVKLKITKNFLNGLDKLHGGVIFSLADYAFAFAANSSGETGVAINANINYLKSAEAGDEIVAEVKLVSRSKRLGTYAGTVVNQRAELIANFNAMAYYINPKM
jgi:acyl-CoA thioesterase